MARIVIEEPCPSGYGVLQAGSIDELTHIEECDPDCRGGSRRVLDPGSYVLIEKVDGLWPLWAYSTLNEGSSIDSILDALAGGEG